ncbi:hypothetical protein WN48_02168 [Eufriesea mexicana]|uniref:Uncharacterized protein n=1 Tax=Eufriesea mexicana TaxID=516756 RepID=A0A310SBV9_9HYME|nr:hypothetical protein WN48_02168 [Eufriesea mexicana]
MEDGGEEREGKNVTGVHGDRGWFTAVSGFHASIYKIALLERPLFSVRAATLSQTFPRQSIAGNQSTLATCALFC